MKRKILRCKKIFVNKSSKIAEAPPISAKIRNKYIKKFEKKGWYNGELLLVTNYSKKKNNLTINCKKCFFYNFITSNICNSKEIKPVLAVNACIIADNGIILIKRSKNSSSCPLWFDFPAGFALFGDSSLKDSLFDKIKGEIGIKKENLFIKKILPIQVFFEKPLSLNIFYVLSYTGTKRELTRCLNKYQKKTKPFILKISDIHNFLIKNNKIVFPEALKIIKENL